MAGDGSHFSELMMQMMDVLRGSDPRPVLLAEDKPDDAELFKRALQENGFRNPLQAVHSGDEAIGYLEGAGRYANRARYPLPHLLLLDPKMPGGSSWEVLEWIRERPAFGDLVVVMFGGSGSPEEEDRAYRLGVTHYHLSPSTPEDFDSAVRRIGEIWLLSGGVA
jgi:two-component system response regulator